MLEIDIASVGVLPSFTTPTTQENYWEERLACELSTMIRSMEQEGFKIRQPEDSDMTGFESSVSSFLASFDTWREDAVGASMSGLPIPAFPSLPAIPVAILQIVLPTLIKLAINLAGKWLEKKLDSTTEAQEIAQKIESLKDVVEKGLLDDINPDLALMKMLSQRQIEIILSHFGTLEDFTYGAGE